MVTLAAYDECSVNAGGDTTPRGMDRGPRLVSEADVDPAVLARKAAQNWLTQNVANRELSPAMRQLIHTGLLMVLTQAWQQDGGQGEPWRHATELVNRVLRWNDSSQSELPGNEICDPIREALRETGIEPPGVKALMIALERPGAAMINRASPSMRYRRRCRTGRAA